MKLKLNRRQEQIVQWSEMVEGLTCGRVLLQPRKRGCFIVWDLVLPGQPTRIGLATNEASMFVLGWNATKHIA